MSDEIEAVTPETKARLADEARSRAERVEPPPKPYPRPRLSVTGLAIAGARVTVSYTRDGVVYRAHDCPVIDGFDEFKFVDTADARIITAEWAK